METVYSKLAKIASRTYCDARAELCKEMVEIIGDAMEGVAICCYDTKKLAVQNAACYGTDENFLDIAKQNRRVEDEVTIQHDNRHYIVCKVAYQNYILIFGKNAEFTVFEKGLATYSSAILSNCLDTQEYNQIVVWRAKSAGSLHDIGNVLGIVSVYMDMLGTNIEESNEGREYYEVAQSELKKVYELIRNVADSANESLMPNNQEFAVEELMDNVFDSCKALSHSGIDIIYKPSGHIVINNDRMRLYRVMLNLVKNSIEAIEGSGRIYIRARECRNEVVFMVLDTGKGIDKLTQRNIFRPFFTEGKEQGKGLGLAIVNKFANTHNSKVSVRSVVGKYTCFIVRVHKDGTNTYS